jgi:hypothetical protein
MEAIQRLASQDKENVMGTLLEAGVDATRQLYKPKHT